MVTQAMDTLVTFTPETVPKPLETVHTWLGEDGWVNTVTS